MEKLAAAIEIESIPSRHTKPIMDDEAKATDIPNDRIRIVDINDHKKAAECLAESFLNDDVAQYFLHTEGGNFKAWTKETRDVHYKIYEYITYAHCLKGLVTTIGPNYDSVALWMPPGKNMDDYLTMFRSGMWRLRCQLSSEGAYRFFQEFLPKLHESKAAALGADDDNSWYLVYIGTKPKAQGLGYAKALIEMVTSQADAEGLKCYLESSHINNFKFYKHRGFQPSPIKPKIILDRGDKPIELDIMVREPDASKYEIHSADSQRSSRRVSSTSLSTAN